MVNGGRADVWERAEEDAGDCGANEGVEKLGKCPVERPIDLRKKVLQSVAALDLSGLGGVSHVGYGGAWVIPWKRGYMD